MSDWWDHEQKALIQDVVLKLSMGSGSNQCSVARLGAAAGVLLACADAIIENDEKRLGGVRLSKSRRSLDRLVRNTRKACEGHPIPMVDPNRS